jgi:RimJ/RimL family protein N-acetyltransferase
VVIGRWRQRLLRLSRRFYARRAHALFAAECALVPAAVWLSSEQPVQFSQTQPLSPAQRNDLLTIWPDAGQYLQAVADGEAMGLLVRAEGRIVHSAYVMFGNKTLCVLGLDPSSALLGNASTVPEYRGRGCQVRSIAERAAMAANAGYKQVVAETAPDNVPSQRALRRAGLCSAGTVRLLLLLSVLVIRTDHPRGRAARWGVCL